MRHWEAFGHVMKSDSGEKSMKEHEHRLGLSQPLQLVVYCCGP